MPLTFRWVQDDERERVALARMRAYAPAAKDLPRFRDRLAADPRAKGGDFLLAELDGEPIGTATSLSLAMWVRGGAAWCQGVAYVGTVRTHRRGGCSAHGEKQVGVASRLMHAALDRARERGECVSALMPFRNSFYERFGYGVVERRHDWTLPTSLVPAGDTDGLRLYRPSDLDALAVCRQKLVCRGQCDVKRTRAAWENVLKTVDDGFLVIDRPDDAGPVRGYLAFDTQVKPDGRWHLRVTDLGYEDPAGLRRLLHFVAGQKDQYATVSLTLPADLPLNRLLKESQLPHRVVPHASAECKPATRMMVRVLDHRAFLEAMTALPIGRSGRAVVAVRETEGTESRFLVDVSDGRATAAPSMATPQFTCADTTWAAVACGDLPATRAVALGLADCTTPAAADALDAFAAGPAPFCTEPF